MVWKSVNADKSLRGNYFLPNGKLGFFRAGVFVYFLHQPLQNIAWTYFNKGGSAIGNHLFNTLRPFNGCS